DNDRAGVVAKVVKVPLNQLVKNIGGLRVQGGIDPVKIDCRVLKCRASADVSAEDRRTGNDIRKLPAHAHDLIRIADAFKIEAASHVPLGMFCRNHERFVTRPKTESDYQRAIAANRWVNEVTRNSLGLRLRADKDRDAENHTAQA